MDKPKRRYFFSASTKKKMREKKAAKPKARRQKVSIENKNLVNKMHYHNICKYYRVAAYYIKAKYDITQSELDLLCFIYDIPIFTSDDFDSFSRMVPFNYRKLNYVMQKGHIIKWRNEGIRKKALYRISPQGKHIVTNFYKRLLGLAPFPESSRHNVVFKYRNSTDKVMAEKMKEINAANRKKAAQVVWVKNTDDTESFTDNDVVDPD